MKTDRSVFIRVYLWLHTPLLSTPKAAKVRGVMVMKQETRNEHDAVALTFQERSYDEIVEFFARGSSPEEILSFRPSHKTQERVRELLELNSADELTEDDALELEWFGQLEHLMQLVKIRAHKYVKKKRDKSPYLRSLTARGAGTSERALRILFNN